MRVRRGYRSLGRRPSTYAAPPSANTRTRCAPAGPIMPRMSGYLAACAIFRNEARYLAEWVAFHRDRRGRAPVPLQQPQRRRLRRGAGAVRGRGLGHADRLAGVPGPEPGIRRLRRADPRRVAVGGLHRPRRVPVLTTHQTRAGAADPVRASPRRGRPMGSVRHLRPQHAACRPRDRELHQETGGAAQPAANSRASSTRRRSGGAWGRTPSSTPIRGYGGPVPRFAFSHDLRVNHYFTRSEAEFQAKIAALDSYGEHRNAEAFIATNRAATVLDRDDHRVRPRCPRRAQPRRTAVAGPAPATGRRGARRR